MSGGILLVTVPNARSIHEENARRYYLRITRLTRPSLLSGGSHKQFKTTAEWDSYFRNRVSPSRTASGYWILRERLLVRSLCDANPELCGTGS